MFDQDEAAVSGEERALDRTTQATGQHYMDGFYDQDEAAVSEGETEGAEETDRWQGAGLSVRVRVRVRVKVRVRVRVRFKVRDCLSRGLPC